MASPELDQPLAWFDGRLATSLAEVSHDPAALDSGGWWAVVLTFEGILTCARFDDVRRAPLPAATWAGPATDAWRSSLSHPAYLAAVRRVRDEIAAGEVYQVNVCRVLSAPAPRASTPLGLAQALAGGNPAPYAGVVQLPAHDVTVVTASPELFLRRSGDLIESRPIKGTGRAPSDLSDKDRAENVMIVDLVRNDLGVVCATGTVEVPDLCVVERHPGLVHLVSTVRGRLRAEARWRDVLHAVFPPGSVSGAPKSSALRIISRLEPALRGPYCGAVGWVDAENRQACLAVGIRTFWWDGPLLCFGTGAGITWASDPQTEWEETELKARRLIRLASAVPVGTASGGDHA